MVAMKLLLPAVVSLLLVLAEPLSAGKILGYFITPSRSHFIVHESLMRGLAASGNEVCRLQFMDIELKIKNNIIVSRVGDGG